jgi:hypothetical protein
VRARRASLGVPIAAIAVALAAVGCGGEPGGGGAEWAGRVDTLNGVVVVSNPATPIASGRRAWRLEWTASTDGTVYAARGSSYEIEVYSPAGGLVRKFGREFTRHSPSPGERDSAMAWLEGRIEQMPQLESRMRREYEIADPKAATGELVVSDDGYVWVRVYGVDDRVEKQLDIFDPTGRYVATLSVPARLSLERVTRDLVYGVLPDELDVQRVVRYAIRRPSDAAAQRERPRRSGDHGGAREV